VSLIGLGGDRREDIDRVKQLTIELNRSTSEWLDTSYQATQPYSTAADRAALRELAESKLAAARELVELLDN